MTTVVSNETVPHSQKIREKVTLGAVEIQCFLPSTHIYFCNNWSAMYIKHIAALLGVTKHCLE